MAGTSPTELPADCWKSSRTTPAFYSGFRRSALTIFGVPVADFLSSPSTPPPCSRRFRAPHCRSRLRLGFVTVALRFKSPISLAVYRFFSMRLIGFLYIISSEGGDLNPRHRVPKTRGLTTGLPSVVSHIELNRNSGTK